MVELALKYDRPMDYEDAKGQNTLEIANATGNKKMIKSVVK